MSKRREVRKKQIVAYQGEALPGVYIIRKGIIRAYSILPNGSEVNAAVYGKGDYFPVETAYGISPNTIFYYEALSDCTIEILSQNEFVEARAKDPNTAVLDSKRYVGALLHVNAIGQATASDKLGHTLRYLALRFGVELPQKSHMRINLKLTQQDIADLSTISRETVSTELAAYRESGAVIEKSKIYTVNLAKLNSQLGDEFASDAQLLK